MLSRIGMNQKQPPAEMMSEFQKYGITPSGDRQTDMAALKEAKQANGESTVQIQAFEQMMQQREEMKAQNGQGEQGQKQMGGGQPPWASLMSSLGIEPQGSKEEDFAAMSAKLTQLSSAATSPEQQANLDTLSAQYEYYYNQSSSMG